MLDFLAHNNPVKKYKLFIGGLEQSLLPSGERKDFKGHAL